MEEVIELTEEDLLIIDEEDIRLIYQNCVE